MRLAQQRLLTTRTRIAVAISLTVLLLLLAVRGALWHTTSGTLLLDFGLHGWPLLAVNVAFYAYLCWLAFCFIRASAGKERVFIVGWFVNILLWPVTVIRPEWTVAEHCVSGIALGVALLAAISLLLAPPDSDDSGNATAAP